MAARAAEQPAIDAAAPEPPAVVLTAEQLRSYLGHLHRGRALETKKKYEQALAELDQAIAINPRGARALSEVGWIAFQLGDLDRAERANRRAVRYAQEPNVKAASLYNLGRVAEERGDRGAAIERYRQSLRLRSNAVVQKRLASLGVTGAAALAPRPPCAEPVGKEALCSCLRGAVEDGGDGWRCTPTGKRVGGLQYWRLEDDAPSDYQRAAHYLVHQQGDRFAAVAELAPPTANMTSVYQRVVLRRIEAKQVGGVTYYEVEARRGADQGQGGGWVMSESSTDYVTYCAPASDGIRCPLRVPVRGSLSIELGDAPDDPATIEAFEDEYGGKPPIERRHQLAVTVAADGTVDIARASGDTGRLSLYLGKAELW